MAQKKIRVKVEFNKRNIVWRYKIFPPKLSTLKQFVLNSFNLGKIFFSLEYIDDEMDRVILKVNDDLTDAFIYSQKEQRKSLKVYVVIDNKQNNPVLTNNNCVVYDDKFIVNSFVNDLKDIINTIYNYYLTWKWDKSTNTDHKLLLSSNRMKVTSTIDKYINQYTFSSIFMDHWMIKDGKYSFKFKFNGLLLAISDEIAIGVITKQYDIDNALGIGYGLTSWSWYVYGHGNGNSSIYSETRVSLLDHGLIQNDEFILDIDIKNGACIFHLYYKTHDAPEVIQLPEIKVPIRIGVSMNTKTTPASFLIVEQQRPYGF